MSELDQARGLGLGVADQDSSDEVVALGFDMIKTMVMPTITSFNIEVLKLMVTFSDPKDSRFVLTGATALTYQRVKYEGFSSNP